MRFKIFITLVLFNLYLFSQQGEVLYELKSIKKNNLDKPMVKGVIKEISLMSLSLKYNNKNSFSKLNKNIPYQKRWYKFSKIFTETYYDWYQDAFSKTTIHNQDIKDKSYQIDYDRMNGWTLLEETKIIQGYTCYKAVRKEKNRNPNKSKNYISYIAWYTPEIPLPYGPIGNGGLPGLILQLEKPNLVVFTASKLILNPKKTVKVLLPKKGERINADQRVKLMRLARKVTQD